jgi:hypothetical protein
MFIIYHLYLNNNQLYVYNFTNFYLCLVKIEIYVKIFYVDFLDDTIEGFDG